MDGDSKAGPSDDRWASGRAGAGAGAGAGADAGAGVRTGAAGRLAGVADTDVCALDGSDGVCATVSPTAVVSRLMSPVSPVAGSSRVAPESWAVGASRRRHKAKTGKPPPKPPGGCKSCATACGRRAAALPVVKPVVGWLRKQRTFMTPSRLLVRTQLPLLLARVMGEPACAHLTARRARHFRCTSPAKLLRCASCRLASSPAPPRMATYACLARMARCSSSSSSLCGAWAAQRRGHRPLPVAADVCDALCYAVPGAVVGLAAHPQLAMAAMRLPEATTATSCRSRRRSA